jgi:hypothetical protein
MRPSTWRAMWSMTVVAISVPAEASTIALPRVRAA